MIVIHILGGVCLFISFTCMKCPDKYPKKWIEILMAITMIIGFVCIGIVSCTQIGGGGGIRMKP